VLPGREKQRVRSVTFSPDGKRLASCSLDGEVRLWDSATGAALGDIDIRPGLANCVAFSPDGHTLAVAVNLPQAGPAAAEARGCVFLWTPDKGKVVARLAGHTGMVLSVAFAGAGRWLVSGGGKANEFGELILWDVTRRAPQWVRRPHRGWIECVAFSPDGRLLVSAGGIRDQGEIRVWEVEPPPATPRRPAVPAPPGGKPYRGGSSHLEFPGRRPGPARTAGCRGGAPFGAQQARRMSATAAPNGPGREMVGLLAAITLKGPGAPRRLLAGDARELWHGPRVNQTIPGAPTPRGSGSSNNVAKPTSNS
jgi:WD40 repeat protein